MANKDRFHDIKRDTANTLINELRMLIAEAREQNNTDKIDPSAFIMQLEDRFKRFDIPMPVPCRGAAHSNMHIDNCGLCMGGDWGWANSKPVRVR